MSSRIHIIKTKSFNQIVKRPIQQMPMYNLLLSGIYFSNVYHDKIERLINLSLIRLILINKEPFSSIKFLILLIVDQLRDYKYSLRRFK
jgi:hypothetical protein